MVWYVYCLCYYGRTLHLSCSSASIMLDVQEVKCVPCVYVQNDVCSSLCSCIFHRFPHRIYLCSKWICKYMIISQRTNSNISDAQCSQKSQIKSDSKFLNHWKNHGPMIFKSHWSFRSFWVKILPPLLLCQKEHRQRSPSIHPSPRLPMAADSSAGQE